MAPLLLGDFICCVESVSKSCCSASFQLMLSAESTWPLVLASPSPALTSPLSRTGWLCFVPKLSKRVKKGEC